MLRFPRPMMTRSYRRSLFLRAISFVLRPSRADADETRLDQHPHECRSYLALQHTPERGGTRICESHPFTLRRRWYFTLAGEGIPPDLV